MSDSTQTIKPLKTWSHLSKQRKRPSEYEIVTTNLHFHTNNKERPFEVGQDAKMNDWYLTYRNNSPLKHDDWDAFRDPEQLVYRTYNILQEGQEAYVTGLLNQFSERGNDQMITKQWATDLARLYTPSRYLYHALQMLASYLHQMSPASTISNLATYQSADHLRWLTHSAYRTCELAKTWDNIGLGDKEREYWEKDPAWQGFRELAEKALVTWDWAEATVVLDVVLKPAVSAAVQKQLGLAGAENGDTLLSLLNDAQMRDAERHQRQTQSLMEFAMGNEDNAGIIQGWVDKWQPLADRAIEAYCAELTDLPDAIENAKAYVTSARKSFGLK
ncbi:MULTISPECIES: aromatic/alkene monooxygenase hydroxylase subunit beta [Cycloclasticus]|jgi:toluene monooxygenase system protein E|uniref:Toluene-4-monooxygenase system protein E n=1 Tax=Cycloclasticus zancles 78-ME TaxID=1198232 RepID=S5TZI8_9GAMM|nr:MULTISPECIES: aromatic/alkene monooxygenase hydroxylase subunit beta [Cycloclasticus]AGS40408.1 Toluene-4-monooxygenase system protein E [Cycloclasticus zancles 78-ME]MDF1829758.1 aromatic/alkene monooxygenase hydroxylase subunit beta [Cycloclasticus pugetii]PHR51778.1 MAG: toluene monooxygenase [Cycloclasticus sp.]